MYLFNQIGNDKFYNILLLLTHLTHNTNIIVSVHHYTRERDHYNKTHMPIKSRGSRTIPNKDLEKIILIT